MEARRFESVDEYIKLQPEKVQAILKKIRKTIRKAAPMAEETISYNIPAYKQEGQLIYFAAHTNHVGVYPAPRSAVEFKDRLASYAGGKGTIQFPYAEPIPYDLLADIVRFRLEANLMKAAIKKKPAAKKARK